MPYRVGAAMPGTPRPHRSDGDSGQKAPKLACSAAMNRTIFVLAIMCCIPACKNKRETEPEPVDKSAVAAEQEAKAEKPAAPQGPEQIPAPKNVAAPPEGAEKSESGLAWVVLKPGEGDQKPEPEDKVTVHYTGWTADGKMFDSSEARKRPATFGVNRVIKGWTEALQMMTKGEKRRVWIPANLAYGETPRRPGAPAGQLTFDVELLDILSPPKVPEDVASPPADAKKTESGLAYKVLHEGKPDGKKPTEKSSVTVHYSGWTKDGKMFDSSISRGRPATFRVTGVIKGWTEGLQLMKEGAKYRLWIPGDLAYGAEPQRPGQPSGQLTFDVELLEVK